MDTHVPTVKDDADPVEIVTLWVGTEIKRVAVLDDAGHVIGVTTDGELMARVRSEVRSGLLTALSAVTSRNGKSHTKRYDNFSYAVKNA